MGSNEYDDFGLSGTFQSLANCGLCMCTMCISTSSNQTKIIRVLLQAHCLKVTFQGQRASLTSGLSKYFELELKFSSALLYFMVCA